MRTFQEANIELTGNGAGEMMAVFLQLLIFRHGSLNLDQYNAKYQPNRKLGSTSVNVLGIERESTEE